MIDELLVYALMNETADLNDPTEPLVLRGFTVFRRRYYSRKERLL